MHGKVAIRTWPRPPFLSPLTLPLFPERMKREKSLLPWGIKLGRRRVSNGEKTEKGYTLFISWKSFLFGRKTNSYAKGGGNHGQMKNERAF
jgi:hypothetical protein